MGTVFILILLIRPLSTQVTWPNIQAGFLASGSFYRPHLPVHRFINSGICDLHPRLQRRVRSWFTQDSLLSAPAAPEI